MTDGLSILRAWQTQGLLRPLDVQLAALVSRMAGTDAPELALAAALASHAVGAGAACLDLAAMAGQPFPGPPAAPEEAPSESSAVVTAIVLPALPEWLQALQSAAARCCVGGADDKRPLVLSGTRLYLRRFWRYEQQVMEGLCLRARPQAATPPPPWFEERLERYFPADEAGSADQRAAARQACSRNLALITGGPGTGKTFTVARIVALLGEMQPREEPLKVRLAAPTGKAAARVQESLREAQRTLVDRLESSAVLPGEAATLHRLLGALPASPYFRHDRANPLDAHVVIVDEASMIDLPIMAKLVEALPPTCRLILVGDRDQLASVEPGRVFGDICSAAAKNPALKACLTRLTCSHRFKPGDPIGRLTAAIHSVAENDRVGAARAWSLLRDPCALPLRQHDAGDGLRDGTGRPRKAFRETVLAGYKAFLEATTPAAVFATLQHFRVLCALRGGPYGVRSVNRLIEEILALHGVQGIDPALRPRRALVPAGEFYDHRLLMITVNDYALGVYNGDIGVVLADPDRGSPRAWFERPAPDSTQPFLALPLALLPQHETAFAMTVHKAQGSEFDRVALLLPPDDASPVLTRELLYTGLTRTRGPLDLWCTQASFMTAAQRRTRRASGLQEHLAQPRKDCAITWLTGRHS